MDADQNLRATRDICFDNWRTYARDHLAPVADPIYQIAAANYTLVQELMSKSVSSENMVKRLGRLANDRRDFYAEDPHRENPFHHVVYDMADSVSLLVSHMLEERGGLTHQQLHVLHQAGQPTHLKVQHSLQLQQQPDHLQHDLQLQHLQQQSPPQDSSSDGTQSPMFEERGQIVIKQEIEDIEEVPVEEMSAADMAKWYNFGQSPSQAMPREKKEKRTGEMRHVMTSDSSSARRSITFANQPTFSSPSKRAASEEEDVDVTGLDQSPRDKNAKRAHIDQPSSSLEPYRASKKKRLGRARGGALPSYPVSDEEDEPPVEVPPPGLWRCFRCEIVLNSQGELQKHMVVHGGKAPAPVDSDADDSDYEEPADVKARKQMEREREMMERQRLSMARASSVMPEATFKTPTLPPPRNFRAGTAVPASAPAASGSLLFSCIECGRGFDSKRGLDSHGKVHQGTQCAICHKFMGKKKLATHMTERHGRFETEEEIAALEAKQVASAIKVTAAVARRERASTVQPATPTSRKATLAQAACDLCGRVFDSMKGMLIHMKKAHEGEPQITTLNNGYVVCPEPDCGASRQNMGQIYHHIRSVHGGLPFSCDECGQKFAMKSEIVIHRKKGHK